MGDAEEVNEVTTKQVFVLWAVIGVNDGGLCLDVLGEGGKELLVGGGVRLLGSKDRMPVWAGFLPGSADGCDI